MTFINGKPLSEIMSDIKSPCKVQKKKKGDYWYIPFLAYLKRLDAVLGGEHYKIQYGNVKSVTLPSEQTFLSCVCELSFIDDEGNICFSVQGIGTFELTYSETNKRYIMLDNSGIRIQQQALKSACKSMQMFGEELMDEESAEKDMYGINENMSDEGTKKINAIKESFCIQGQFQIIREDTKTQKPIYKIYGYRIVGNVMEKALSAILFYPNLYNKSIDNLNKVIALCKDNRQHKLSVMVTLSKYKEDSTMQYIFRGFSK